MKRAILVLLTYLGIINPSFAQQSPEVYTLWPSVLQQHKKAYEQKNELVTQKVFQIVKKANEYLKSEAHSVMDKNLTPSSGTKHDYMSLGPYWWPNPAKANGLPYIRKDGQRNPEIRKITDREYLGELENRCKYLALAYYFTNDERYATKARSLLKTWFIHPDTKMNPNLDFGQAIPGLNEGRGIGIIESRLFVDILNWVGLLSNDEAFKREELPKLKNWFKAYLQWMVNSENGKDEAKSKNNHGTFYELQVATFASFVGDENTVREVFSGLDQRMKEQFEADGKQPLELERTNALGYSTMNLGGWFDLAILGEKHQINLWNQTNPMGGGMAKAYKWLFPFAVEGKTFPYQQISNYNKSEFYPLILMADQKYNHSPISSFNTGEDDEHALAYLLYSFQSKN